MRSFCFAFRFLPTFFKFVSQRSATPLLPLIVLLMSGLVLSAQVAPTTRLSGEVMDSSGAFVPGAQVDLIMSGTQAVRHASTNGEGRYIFDLVPPGSYELNVAANGFATFHQSGIQLDVNVPADVRVKLTVRGAVQQVNVIENAPMIDGGSGTRCA